MSEFINNREKRQEVLKELIMELHDGKLVEEVKGRFAKLIEGVSASEISEMESKLIENGMPVEEIQRLCDVHAAVFEGSVQEIHSLESLPEKLPGHPVHTLKKENIEIKALIEKSIIPKLEDDKINISEKISLLSKYFEKLLEIDKHYSRKENLIFPFMEKYGITAPPKVMWGVDDEIRAAIKSVISKLNIAEDIDEKFKTEILSSLKRTIEMISKEENILFPMILETFKSDDWKEISASENEIGFTLIEKPVNLTFFESDNQESWDDENEYSSEDNLVKFDAGAMTPTEINAILNTLPLDMTFVDKNGRVKYFSQGKDRIFARTKTILGREVKNCHPPASVHIVEKIVSDLESGKKDNEDFWIKMGDKFVYIRYFAVRGKEGEFLGTLEVTQDIKGISQLQGEKRLMSDS